MNPLEVVKKALSDIEQGKIDSGIYAEDFVFSGPVPEPLKRDEYLDFTTKLTEAMPDWNFHARDFMVSGDVVEVDVEITGTQTRTLRPVMPEMRDLPPTNKRIALPEERLTITVREGKIARFHAAVPEGGGVLGILAQLGAPMKKAA